MNPDGVEERKGARPPRASFSSPSQKTSVAPNIQSLPRPIEHKGVGREACPITSEAGALPCVEIHFK